MTTVCPARRDTWKKKWIFSVLPSFSHVQFLSEKLYKKNLKISFLLVVSFKRTTEVFATSDTWRGNADCKRKTGRVKSLPATVGGPLRRSGDLLTVIMINIVSARFSPPLTLESLTRRIRTPCGFWCPGWREAEWKTICPRESHCPPCIYECDSHQKS